MFVSTEDDVSLAGEHMDVASRFESPPVEKSAKLFCLSQARVYHDNKENVDENPSESSGKGIYTGSMKQTS